MKFLDESPAAISITAPKHVGKTVNPGNGVLEFINNELNTISITPTSEITEPWRRCFVIESL
ncbi:hypothetical protein EsCd1HHP024_03149 [Escherichia sp. HH091_1A]|nr:hypothetical protein EsCd1HHP024_03149 [Escherichia sp. HH091_1A]